MDCSCTGWKRISGTVLISFVLLILQTMLSSAHGELCVWRGSSVPTPHIAMRSSAELQTQLRERFEQLQVLQHLPPLAEGEWTSYQDPVLQSLGVPASKQNVTAALLALCGWRPVQLSAEKTTLSCDECTRDAGIWLFNDEAYGQLCNFVCLVHDILRLFDPVHEHRSFCPWITQPSADSLPGWRHVAQQLQPTREPLTPHAPVL